MSGKDLLPDEKRVADVLERVEATRKEIQGPQFKDIVLSNGGKVRLRPLPGMILQVLSREHPEPEVPITEAQVGGKTQRVPNPDDPAYHRALEQHRLEMGDATLKLILLKSMEILEYPPGVPKYEEDTEEWIAELTFMGITVPDEPMIRKHIWLQYKILGVLGDFSRVHDICQELGGISEKEIRAAEARFPSDGPGSTSEGLDKDGD